jgi:hypothetical protein
MTDISLPASSVGIEFPLSCKHDRTTGDFPVARVLDQTVAVLSRNFPAFFIVSTIAQVPSRLLIHLFIFTGGGPHLSAKPGAILATAGLGLMGMVLGAFSQSIMLHRAFADLRGRPVSFGESLRVACSRFFPVIGLSICTTSIEGIGLLCFIFPALMLTRMWFVATPACVVEQLGSMDSMRRSSRLTKGHRWKIFRLMIFLFATIMVISGSLVVSLNVLSGAGMALIGDVLGAGVSGAVGTIAAAVAYYELRVLKD